METMVGGTLTHNPKDILAYGKIWHFYIDTRTRFDVDSATYLVKPLGKTVNDYWLYCCPDCGKFHAVHDDIVKRKRPFDCGCRGHNPKKHTRKMPWPDGSLIDLPSWKISLDVEDW